MVQIDGLRELLTASRSRNPDRVSANEFRVEVWFTILKKHEDDFLQISKQFIDSSPLGMGSGPTWNVSNVKPCVRVEFDDSCEVAHTFASGLPYDEDIGKGNCLSNAYLWPVGVHRQLVEKLGKRLDLRMLF